MATEEMIRLIGTPEQVEGNLAKVIQTAFLHLLEGDHELLQLNQLCAQIGVMAGKEWNLDEFITMFEIFIRDLDLLPHQKARATYLMTKAMEQVLMEPSQAEHIYAVAGSHLQGLLGYHAFGRVFYTTAQVELEEGTRKLPYQREDFIQVILRDGDPNLSMPDVHVQVPADERWRPISYLQVQDGRGDILECFEEPVWGVLVYESFDEAILQRILQRHPLIQVFLYKGGSTAASQWSDK